jgi:hypothetical protein
VYAAGQVSHHPPVSAFHCVNRKGGWHLSAVMHPKTKFLGNSAGTHTCLPPAERERRGGGRGGGERERCESHQVRA